MEGYSLQESLKLVQEADNFVELEVMFEVQDAVPPNSGVFEVHMKKKTASLNLGITINGSRSRGDTIWISNLKKGGIAYRSGMLHSGDVIIAINDSSLENSNLREAAQILLNAKESVTLRIGKETSKSRKVDHHVSCLGSSLVWPHEVEPWFHSWYRGRVETLDAKYNLISLLVCPHEVGPWFHSCRVETLDAKYNLIFR